MVYKALADRVGTDLTFTVIGVRMIVHCDYLSRFERALATASSPSLIRAVGIFFVRSRNTGMNVGIVNPGRFTSCGNGNETERFRFYVSSSPTRRLRLVTGLYHPECGPPDSDSAVES